LSRGESRFPNSVQAEFLRACLLEGAAGDEAFAAWLHEVGDPVAGLRRQECADKNLFALLHRSRAGDRDKMPAVLLPVLRAAAVHEQLRGESLAAAAAEMLAGLEDAGIEPLVIGGAALAWGHYPEQSLRHCHNVDVLVADPGAARAALAALECVPDTGSVRLRHPSGTLLALHPQLYRERWRRSPVDLAARAEEIVVAGKAARGLGPADLLVETGANAFAAARPGLRFLADTWFLVAGGRVDWERVTEHATLARRAVPTSLVLARLTGIAGAPVPNRPVAGLERARLREAAVDLAVGAVRRARQLRARTARP
jgi:hypothetical protein